MTREKGIQRQIKEGEEMIALMKQLTDGEKREVRGVMIGLQIARQIQAQDFTGKESRK